MKGSSEEAAKHQHGIQVKETGVVGKPVTEDRVAALETHLTMLEEDIVEIKQFIGALKQEREAKKAEVPKKEKEKVA